MLKHGLDYNMLLHNRSCVHGLWESDVTSCHRLSKPAPAASYAAGVFSACSIGAVARLLSRWVSSFWRRSKLLLCRSLLMCPICSGAAALISMSLVASASLIVCISMFVCYLCILVVTLPTAAVKVVCVLVLAVHWACCLQATLSHGVSKLQQPRTVACKPPNECVLYHMSINVCCSVPWLPLDLLYVRLG